MAEAAPPRSPREPDLRIVKCIMLCDVPASEPALRHKVKAGDLLLGHPTELVHNSRYQMKKVTQGRANQQDEYLMFDIHHIAELSEEKFQLLLAVKEADRRLKVHKDHQWLTEAKSLTVGDIVTVTIDMEPYKVKGTVRYKGPLGDAHPGTWFGVEYFEEFHGLGVTDGEFLGVQYFDAPEDSSWFVSIHRLRAANEGARMLTSSENFMQHLLVKVGNRVVWLDDDGQPHGGFVRWLGFLPCNYRKGMVREDEHREIHAGVEFDEPIGKGNGRYKDQRLFRAKKNHALLLPVLGLLPECSS